MHIMNPHFITHGIYSGSNTTLQFGNDTYKIELESTTETCVKNIRPFTKNFKCRLRQSLYRHKYYKYSKSDNAQNQIASICNQSDDENENLENHSSFFENNIEANYINQDIDAPNLTLGHSKWDFEALYNKSEIYEKTDQELQGNIESEVDRDRNDYYKILESNNETVLSKTNDNMKINIIENIIIKPATSRTNDDMMQANDKNIKASNNNLNLDDQYNVIAHGVKVAKNSIDYQRVSNYNDVLEENNETVLKQTNSSAEVEDCKTIAPKSNDSTAETTSNKAKGTKVTDLSKKSDDKNFENKPQFDNFKVPNEITHSRKKIVKKQQPRFVLTHVVGGYIIQESNVAFPVREPQTKRTTPHNSNTEEPSRTEVKDEKRVVQEAIVTEEPPPQAEVEEVEKDYVKEDADGEFNPFARLRQTTVKNWTVEELSNHLLKFNWEETASLLQDNEIDGASLFLVTKTQLMIIGVDEEQADVISEFVQSGPSRGN